MPTLEAAKGTENLIGIVVGFALGSMVMIALPLCLGEDDNEEEKHQKFDDECEKGARVKEVEMASNPDSSTFENTSQTTHVKANPPEKGAAKIKIVFQRMRSRVFQMFENDELDVRKAATRDHGPFPAVFAVAVYIDSAMDGLLVGISMLSGASAGVFMAVAMASEMGFLGLSFALAIGRRPKWQTIPAIMGGPLCMLIGAVVGGVGANSLATNEPLLVGCTSFGVAALLYMVTEELLVSAHEDGFGHTWWVDIQVFVGFLLAVVVGKSLNPEE